MISFACKSCFHVSVSHIVFANYSDGVRAMGVQYRTLVDF